MEDKNLMEEFFNSSAENSAEIDVQKEGEGSTNAGQNSGWPMCTTCTGAARLTAR